MEKSNTAGELSGEGKARRSVLNVFIRPKRQVGLMLGMTFFTLGAAVVLLAVSRELITVKLNELVGGSIVGRQTVDQIINILSNDIFILILITAYAGVQTILFTHRIYGPMVPLKKHIESLKAGNYESRVKLRKHDELLEFEDMLNELAAVLEEKHKKKDGETGGNVR